MRSAPWPITILALAMKEPANTGKRLSNGWSRWRDLDLPKKRKPFAKDTQEAVFKPPSVAGLHGSRVRLRMTECSQPSWPPIFMRFLAIRIEHLRGWKKRC